MTAPLEWLSAHLIAWAARRTPDMLIGRPGDDYLRRWFVIPRNPIFNIYLHQFLRSDDDRALHDHPWINLSLLLRGEYTEHTIAAGGVRSRVVYRTGNVKLRAARAAHRIELHAGPCWSLFLTGPKIRRWGFHCPNGWRHWKQFTDPGNSGHVGRGCD
jgi:hypothetical protein